VKYPAFALIIMAGLIFLPTVSHSQWFSQIRTESDWETLYNRSYFDYSTYQLYRELAEGAIITDSVGYFRGVLGNPVLDILGTTPNNFPSASFPDATPKRDMSLYFRSGLRIYNNAANSSYLLLSGSDDVSAYELKGRKEKNNWEMEKRSLSWRNGWYAATLGNYDMDVGLGLSIGRFDYRPVAGIPDTAEQSDDFLYPDNSYYNGIKIEHGKGSILYSSKRYPGLDKRFVGGALSRDFEGAIIGISGGGVFLKANGYARRMGTISAFLIDSERGVQSEAAYSEAGVGVAARVKKSGYDIAMWHYDDSYLNLQSSGIARPDYHRFEDSHFVEEFRQAQAGESGLSAQKNLALGRCALGLATEIWKQSAHGGISLDNLIYSRYGIRDNVWLNARFSSRGGQIEERFLSELGANAEWPIPIQTTVSLWSERSKIIDAKSFYYIFFSIPLKTGFLFNARFRTYFDGDHDYFLEEVLNIGNVFRAKTTYRWQRSYSGDIGPLYFVLEVAL